MFLYCLPEGVVYTNNYPRLTSAYRKDVTKLCNNLHYLYLANEKTLSVTKTNMFLGFQKKRMADFLKNVLSATNNIYFLEKITNRVIPYSKKNAIKTFFKNPDFYKNNIILTKNQKISYPNTKLNIYIDGSASYSKKNKNGGSAFIAYKKNKEIGRGMFPTSNLTSDKCEKFAMIKAYEYILENNFDNVTIWYDNYGVVDFLVNQAKDKFSKKLKILKELLDERGLKTYYRHVKAHSGNERNNAVDRLANQARKEQKGSTINVSI